jgi:glutamate dehydrogenase (NAD(P)+)
MSNQKAPRKTCEKFLDDAFEHLQVHLEMQQLLRSPYREVRFELPLKRDNGSISMFYGYRVQHNQSRGPFKGGLRYHKDVDLEHFVALAEIMTWKTSLLDLPFGGGKGGINCDPNELSAHELETLTKRYVQRVSMLIGPDRDIPAPDMGTGPQEMAWIVDAFSVIKGFNPAVATGKPLELGGSQGRMEATGYGVAILTEMAAEAHGIAIEGAKVAIQGVGNVARYAAETLYRKGAKIVALSDSKCGIYQNKGFDIDKTLKSVSEIKKEGGCLQDLKGDHRQLSNEDLLELDVDILLPAAIDGVINQDNVNNIQAKLIIEAANMPITCYADSKLHERGTIILPDILANAGGVTVSYLEWVQNRQRYQWAKEQVIGELEKRMQQAWTEVKVRAEDENLNYRQASYVIAVERIIKAINLRGL